MALIVAEYPRAIPLVAEKRETEERIDARHTHLAREWRYNAHA